MDAESPGYRSPACTWRAGTGRTSRNPRPPRQGSSDVGPLCSTNQPASRRSSRSLASVHASRWASRSRIAPVIDRHRGCRSVGSKDIVVMQVVMLHGQRDAVRRQLGALLAEADRTAEQPFVRPRGEPSGCCNITRWWSASSRSRVAGSSSGPSAGVPTASSCGTEPSTAAAGRRTARARAPTWPGRLRRPRSRAGCGHRRAAATPSLVVGGQRCQDAVRRSRRQDRVEPDLVRDAGCADFQPDRALVGAAAPQVAPRSLPHELERCHDMVTAIGQGGSCPRVGLHPLTRPT